MNLVAEASNEDEDDEDTKACKHLFKNLKIFLSREVPRESLLFVISSFGGVVSWEGDGAPFKEADQSITHQVILNDPFLVKRVEDGTDASSYVPLWDEFRDSARMFLIETYCRIHQRIDLSVLAEKLNLNDDDAERWVSNLIHSSKLDARINLESGTVNMEASPPSVYEQLIDHSQVLASRTYKLYGHIMEPMQAQAAR